MPPITGKKIEKPKLVNRGASGLLDKLTPKKKAGIVPQEVPNKPVLTAPRAKFQIAPALKTMAVDIDSLVPDPVNARLHPERNKEAIKESLLTYGQVKPVVVRRETRVIVAGNGTTEVAKELGWKKIAAVFVDMNEVEAAGFGLADNKTAELAKWDYEIVARLDLLIQEAGLPQPGWSTDELEVLRMADWVPPEVSDEEFDGTGPATLKMSQDEKGIIDIVVGMVREREGNKKITEGECLVMVCNEWMTKPSYETEEE